MSDRQTPYKYFRPRKMASWVTELDDILWPSKAVIEKIKKRAKGFADAGIDTAINYGFHLRFDFSDYFEMLHGYLKDVCDELHKYGIKFMDHYSCNLVERPRTKEDFFFLRNAHRHHVLLHKDSKAAEFAQYEGYRFQDICEKRIADGTRGYSWNYQAEMFCHNNPNFLDMHRKYLERLFNDVPIDGLEIDDMCDYGAFSTCCCDYCKERFRKEFGRELPPFEDKDFWGNTDAHPTAWGNYENPAFRDWVMLKANSAKDHIKMVKEILGDRPLMTCCSATGPMVLNGLGLNLERFMDNLDLLMLENCGMGVDTVLWDRKEAEALLQKNIALNMGRAPAITLSYFVYDPGAYLGWALARFWGVSNWASTMAGRLSHDPGDFKETHELLAPCNNWEDRYSRIDPCEGEDIYEVRLVNNLLCRENGHRDDKGRDHWTKVAAWSRALLHSNVGYRFLRYTELADEERLISEDTPLIIDNCGVVSDAQFNAIKAFLEKGGKVILSLPFGIRDEKGYLREKPLSEELLNKGYKGLVLLENVDSADASVVSRLISENHIVPRIRQTEGDPTWAVRIRKHKDKLVMHVLNRALEAIPHPSLTSSLGPQKILKDFKAVHKNDVITYEVNIDGIVDEWNNLTFMTPETGSVKHEVKTEMISDRLVRVSINVKDLVLYGIIS
jgi:hypothetical protein